MLQLAVSQMLYGATLPHDRVRLAPSSPAWTAVLDGTRTPPAVTPNPQAPPRRHTIERPAAIWGDRMRGNMACLVGIHHWSDWEVQDPQRPSEQVRTCARCPRTKNNAAVVPLSSLFWLGAWMVRYALWTCSGRRAGGPKFSQRIRRVERDAVTLSQFDRIRPVPQVGA